MTTTAPTASQARSYFDLHTTGIGYIRRARDVPVKGRRGSSFLACTVAALVGPAQDPSLRFLDVIVSGTEAKNLVRGCIGQDDRNAAPLVKFRLGDLWADAFIRPNGPNKDQPAASLKARLLKADPVDMEALASIERHELTTRGIGYVKRITQVRPKASDPFLACTIATLSGPVDQPEYRYIDTIVSSPSAEHLIRRCIQACQEKRKIFIAFDLSDMQVEAYLRKKPDAGPNDKPEAGANLESKLTRVGLIKIDGQRVYPVQARTPTSESATANDGADHGQDGADTGEGETDSSQTAAA